MPIIIIIIIAIYVVLAAGTWHYLGSIDKNKKFIFILGGLIISFILTFITYTISKNGIVYPNMQIEGAIQTVIVAVFTALNGILFLPYTARLLDKVEDGDINQTQFKNRILILIFVLIILLIFECNYLRSTQEGILEIYQKNIK